MSYVVYTCNYPSFPDDSEFGFGFLRNSSFLITVSLQTGMSIPLTVLPPDIASLPVPDPSGHTALNTARNNRRIVSHNLVVDGIFKELREFSVPSSTKDVPAIQYQQRERCQGDILVHSFNHPFCHPIRNLSATADIVLDVTLINSTHISRGGDFSFDPSSILRSEGKKLQEYRAGYELNGLAFAPLVADAYGVIGPWALNFFIVLLLFVVNPLIVVMIVLCVARPFTTVCVFAS